MLLFCQPNDLNEIFTSNEKLLHIFLFKFENEFYLSINRDTIRKLLDIIFNDESCNIDNEKVWKLFTNLCSCCLLLFRIYLTLKGVFTFFDDEHMLNPPFSNFSP